MSLTNPVRTRLSNCNTDLKPKYSRKRLPQSVSSSTAADGTLKIPLDKTKPRCTSFTDPKQHSFSLSDLNQPRSHSDDANIWIEHHLSSSTIDPLLNREILDAAV